MSDTDPETAEWVWDDVPHYRLNDKIIHEYLSEHWEGYSFLIEVKPSSLSILVSCKIDRRCTAERREIQILGSAQAQKGIHGQMAEMPCQQSLNLTVAY